MALSVGELKAIAALLSRARQLIEDALVIAEDGADIAVAAKLKPLLFRAKDTQADIDGRVTAAENQNL